MLLIGRLAELKKHMKSTELKRELRSFPIVQFLDFIQLREAKQARHDIVLLSTSLRGHDEWYMRLVPALMILLMISSPFELMSLGR